MSKSGSHLAFISALVLCLLLAGAHGKPWKKAASGSKSVKDKKPRPPPPVKKGKSSNLGKFVKDMNNKTLVGSANNNNFCKYEWQGTAPTCEHGGYCDNGLIWVKDAGSCSGANCKNADFGSGCWTGNKALCQKTCNPISESACYLSCDVSPPCVNEVTGVSVTPVLPYPTKPKAMSPSATLINATVKAINYGSVSQTVTVTFAFQYQVTTTITYTKAIGFSEKTSAKVGIPLIGETGLEFSASQTFTDTDTITTTQTSTLTIAIPIAIPAYTQQTVTALGSSGTIVATVPMNVVTSGTCSDTSTTNEATLTTDGSLVSSKSELTFIYGGTSPAPPPINLPQANATCISNPNCVLFGLNTGDCCPGKDGNYNACCAFCSVKPACASSAQDNTTMCCPAQNNVPNPCCAK